MYAVCLFVIHKLAGGGIHFITPYGLEVENLYSGARLPPYVIRVFYIDLCKITFLLSLEHQVTSFQATAVVRWKVAERVRTLMEGSRVEQKTRTKLEGRLYLTKIGYIVAPKNFLLTTEKNDSVVHVFISSSNKSLQDTKEIIFNVS